MPQVDRPSFKDQPDLVTPQFEVRTIDTTTRAREVVGPDGWWPGPRRLGGRDIEQYEPACPPAPGLITPTTRVATMGSCFAQEIKRWLITNGYSYLQTERGPGTQVGSARFGAVFNTACVRQEFEHAEGLFHPVERHWRIGNALADPYRRSLGWPDERSAEAERAAHAAGVREMVELADVLIVTIGVAEVWRNRQDKATFAILPPGEEYDPARHEFSLLGVEENLANLERAYALTRARNPRLRWIITVSPVPLAATFRDVDITVANSASKAILRLAADEFCRRHPEALYFPAYEIVTSLTRWAWEADNRHVRPEVVDRIMGCFIRAYGPRVEDAPRIEPKPGAQRVA